MKFKLSRQSYRCTIVPTNWNSCGKASFKINAGQARPKLHPLYPLMRMWTKTQSVLYESFFNTEKVMCTKVNVNEKIKH